MAERNGQDEQDQRRSGRGMRRAGRTLRRLLRVLQWGVNLVVVAAVLLVFTPVGTRLSDWLVHVDGPAAADFIVVLGGEPERGVEGAQLYREGWAPTVIITSWGEYADGLARMTQAYGVPPEHMLVDRESTRTASHPGQVAALPGVDRETSRLIVVTSSLHTRRARACFLAAGYKHVRMVCPGWRYGGRFRYVRDDNWGRRAADLRRMVYEATANVYYWIRGWI